MEKRERKKRDEENMEYCDFYPIHSNICYPFSKKSFGCQPHVNNNA